MLGATRDKCPECFAMAGTGWTSAHASGCSQASPLGDIRLATTSALTTQIGGNHYKHLAIQPIEYCQKNRLGYCESNVVKYVTRHGFKGGAEDIRKAIHNLQLLLELEYSTTTQQENT